MYRNYINSLTKYIVFIMRTFKGSYVHIFYANCFVQFILCVAIDHLKPILKDLQNIVSPKVAARWYEFGIQLLDNSHLPKLEEIYAAYTHDYRRGCLEMFKYWLQVDKVATWGKVIEALEAPSMDFLTESQNVDEEVKGINACI